jgi:hypothetical protein
VSYPDGEISRITPDLNEYGQISLGVTADGSTIVTIQQVPRSNLWLSTSNYNDARQITQGDNDGFNSVDAKTTVSYSVPLRTALMYWPLPT